MARVIQAVSIGVAASLLAVSPVFGAPQPGRGGPSTREAVEPSHDGPRAGMPSEKEQQEVAAFMRQYAPNRWMAMEALPEAGTVRRGVMIYVVARWRHLEMLREEDPSLYEIKVQQLAVEDDIYGLLARTHSPAEREPLRKTLHGKVTELVRLGLAERQQRIQRLRESLKAEEERLLRDQKSIETMVERRTDAFITDGPVTLRADLPRRAGRPAERRPGGTSPANEPDEP